MIFFFFIKTHSLECPSDGERFIFSLGFGFTAQTGPAGRNVQDPYHPKNYHNIAQGLTDQTESEVQSQVQPEALPVLSAEFRTEKPGPSRGRIRAAGRRAKSSPNKYQVSSRSGMSAQNR